MTLIISPGAEPVPGYRLVDRLGIGGFGEVWKAIGKDTHPIALKIIELKSRQSDEELQSLQLIASLRHPHLLHIVGHWVSDQHLMIATELADGTSEDLAERYRQQGQPGIPRDQLLRIMSQAAVAIDYLNAPAHEYSGRKVSIQHRDIKPENIFLLGEHVRVGDFGLVKVLEQLSDQHSGKGTLLYAPPEMLEGEISHASDQYSLALTYCNLATGQLPFQGKTTLEKLWSRVKAPPQLDDYPPAERPVYASGSVAKPGGSIPFVYDFRPARWKRRWRLVRAAVRTEDKPERTERITQRSSSVLGVVPAPYAPADPKQLASSLCQAASFPFLVAVRRRLPAEIISGNGWKRNGVLVPGGEYLSGERQRTGRIGVPIFRRSTSTSTRPRTLNFNGSAGPRITPAPDRWSWGMTARDW
ncbi:MAG: serine/threonine-protein kinase [Planctomycetota bacterium]